LRRHGRGAGGGEGEAADAEVIKRFGFDCVKTKQKHTIGSISAWA
jgi:hypothetical protein